MQLGGSSSRAGLADVTFRVFDAAPAWPRKLSQPKGRGQTRVLSGSAGSEDSAVTAANGMRVFPCEAPSLQQWVRRSSLTPKPVVWPPPK